MKGFTAEAQRNLCLSIRKEKLRNDPKLVAAARELRDKYIEQVNAGLLLPPSACGKYDVSRQLAFAPAPAPGSVPTQFETHKLLEAA